MPMKVLAGIFAKGSSPLSEKDKEQLASLLERYLVPTGIVLNDLGDSTYSSWESASGGLSDYEVLGIDTHLCWTSFCVGTVCCYKKLFIMKQFRDAEFVIAAQS